MSLHPEELDFHLELGDAEAFLPVLLFELEPHSISSELLGQMGGAYTTARSRLRFVQAFPGDSTIPAEADVDVQWSTGALVFNRDLLQGDRLTRNVEHVLACKIMRRPSAVDECVVCHVIEGVLELIHGPLKLVDGKGIGKTAVHVRKLVKLVNTIIDCSYHQGGVRLQGVLTIKLPVLLVDRADEFVDRQGVVEAVHG